MTVVLQRFCRSDHMVDHISDPETLMPESMVPLGKVAVVVGVGPGEAILAQSFDLSGIATYLSACAESMLVYG